VELRELRALVRDLEIRWGGKKNVGPEEVKIRAQTGVGYDDPGTGAIDGGASQYVLLGGREYERYLDGALNEPLPDNYDYDDEVLRAWRAGELRVAGCDACDQTPPATMQGDAGPEYYRHRYLMDLVRWVAEKVNGREYRSTEVGPMLQDFIAEHGRLPR